jgi:phenylalanyl-tRNA synthetase beta chain
MNASRRWLEEFLRCPLEARDLVGKLAMLGAPVDAVESLHAGLGEIRIAVVESVAPHPNADRLRVCEVNDGSSTLKHVVCGAPNVTAGRKYPFAAVGSTIPHGKGGAPMKLERAKIRGEVSEGMLCSARELGLGQDHDGILELKTDAPPGTPLLDAIPLADDRLIIDVTPNRPDLLGHKGLARELAAAYNVPFRLPQIPGAERLDVPSARRAGANGAAGNIRIELNDLVGCKRFHAALIRGARVGPSPAWLARRLEAVGVRSISNVVDATNYVMLELNQPMHAFDAARLRGATIVVRRPTAGESSLVTLDNATRTLDAEMTLITDGGGPIGLAGIMGGASSEVGPGTTDVLLEAAWWEPSGIRRTRRRLGMITDASYRFERGIDLWGGADAMRRCIELVLVTAGGELVDSPLDLWPEPTHPPRIFLRPSRVAQVLGVELSWHEIERCLVAIGATVVSKPDDGRIAVDVPGWRPDLKQEIDLIEEVARVHGYENLPVELRPARVGSLPDASIEVVTTQVRRGLAGLGLLEASTLPLTSVSGSQSVRLLNPPSATEPWLRRELLPALVQQVRANWAHHVRDVRLFEVGTVFEARSGARPLESQHVAGVVTGAREPAHWSGTGRADFDRWDLAGLFQAAVALANPGAVVQVEGNAWVAVAADGRKVARAALLETEVQPWAAPVWGFEVELDASARQPVRYRSLPSTPASERDLALVLPDGIAAARVGEILQQAAGPLLVGLDLLDEYRGAGLPAGARSAMFRLTFRAPDRTLRDQEVDEVERRVLTALERELGVRRREAGPSAAQGET